MNIMVLVALLWVAAAAVTVIVCIDIVKDKKRVKGMYERLDSLNDLNNGGEEDED